jgi:hypothetical protein
MATVWGQPAARIDATDCDLRARRPRSDLVAGPPAARAPLVRRGTRGHDGPPTSTQSRAAGRRIVLLSISTTRPRLPEGRQMVLLTCRGTLVSKLFARGKVLRSEPLKAAGVGPRAGGPDPASAVAPEARSRLELFLSWPHASFTHPGAHGKRTPRRKAIYALARLRMSA